MSENDGSEDGKRAWTPEVIIQAFKEVVTALLGLAVVIYTLILAGQTIALVGQEQRMADAKDVLLLILGLAGVVVGYYFGRVPADARATQATERAEEATAEAEQVRAQARSAADDVERVMDRLAPATAGVRGAEEASVVRAVDSDLRQIREELRAVGNIGRRR